MRTITKVLFVAALVGSAASCAETAVKSAPTDPSPAVLEGRWRLDRESSDDVRGRLLPLFEKNERKWRRRAEQFEDLPPPERHSSDVPDDGISDVLWMQRERQKEIQALIALLTPATQLDIQRSERTIRILSDKGEGTRVITPGDRSSLFLPVGGFDVSAAWQKNVLVVDSRGTGENRMRIAERFLVRGDTLEEVLEVKIPNIGKQTFKMIYTR